MKYDIKYACGHEGTVDLFGKGKDRKWRIEYLESGKCPECQKKIQVQIAKERGYVDLEGTEKQMAWALQIRNELLPKIEKFSEEVMAACASEPDKVSIISESIEIVRNKRSAGWWIDKNGASPEFAFEGTVKAVMEKREKEKVTALQAKAEGEMILRPEGGVVSEVLPEVRISQDGDSVFVEKAFDKAITPVVKGAGFRWAGDKWKLSLGVTSGKAEDRAAEVATLLLDAGFQVKVPSQDARNKCVNGTWEPKYERWVYAPVQKDVLVITCEKGFGEVHGEAMRIPMAKRKGEEIRVPVSSWESVMEFADIYNFQISDKAKEMVENYKKRVLMVNPQKKEMEYKDNSGGLKKIMDTRDVLEDLIDD